MCIRDRFKLEVDRYGWYRISPECAPNMSITNFGTSTAGDNTMWTIVYATAQDQEWAFEPVDAPTGETPEADGVYLIRSLASNKVLDVNNYGTENNTPIVQQFHHTNKNQQFMLRDAAVSYTHLDVYKRQVRGSPPVNSTSVIPSLLQSLAILSIIDNDINSAEHFLSLHPLYNKCNHTCKHPI